MVFELLQQRTTRDDEAALHCREITLRFTPDCQQLVLSRYIELYRPEGVEWVERSHRISVNALLRWIIANGEAQAVEQGSDLPGRGSMN